ncbi:hypothetical protein H8E52_06700 [bacterium]|nr:hypothetical protein [bacterium]
MAGAGQVQLEQGPHTVQIEYLSGTYPDFVRVDYVELVLDESPAAMGTWGTVKTLY